MNVRMFHHLVCGEVVYEHADNPGQIGVMHVNGIVADKQRHVPTRVLGKMQESVQINFMRHMDNDPKIKIMDVVILSFSFMGEMTEDELRAPPAGTKLQEVKPAANQEKQAEVAEFAPTTDDLDKLVAEAKPKLALVPEAKAE